MLTEEIILTKIEEKIEEIKKYGVKRIGIFGSYSRNEQTETSDLDFLIEFNKGQKTFDNYMDLKFYLEELFKRKIDLAVAEAIKPDLRANILRSVKYAKGA
jgi:predicted nucleotidyltransferase